MWLVIDQPVKRPASDARTRLAEDLVDRVRAEISLRRQLFITGTRNHEKFMRASSDLEKDVIRGK